MRNIPGGKHDAKKLLLLDLLDLDGWTFFIPKHYGFTADLSHGRK